MFTRSWPRDLCSWAIGYTGGKDEAMKNEEIIAKIAISSGTLTEEEVGNMIASGQDIPLHTFKGWRDRGMTVRKGEHGIECKLWKLKNRKNAEGEEPAESEEQYYLTKSYLFTREQVDCIDEGGTG